MSVAGRWLCRVRCAVAALPGVGQCSTWPGATPPLDRTPVPCHDTADTPIGRLGGGVGRAVTRRPCRCPADAGSSAARRAPCRSLRPRGSTPWIATLDPRGLHTGDIASKTKQGKCLLCGLSRQGTKRLLERLDTGGLRKGSRTECGGMWFGISDHLPSPDVA